MSEDNRHNGWANYETWAVNLWLDNEEHSQQMLRCFAESAIEDCQIDGSGKSEAIYECSRAIREFIEENVPELDGLFADLLNGALSEVNWREIAEHAVNAELEEMDVQLPE